MYKTTFKNLLHFFTQSLTNLFSSRNVFGKLFLTVLIFVFSSNGIPDGATLKHNNFNNWEWELIKENSSNENMWSARAGLQALNHKGKFYILGGRTPIDSDVFGASIIHGDVWKSRNKGKTWRKILSSNQPFPAPPQHWANRAYFQAVSQGKYMYVLGGQDFNVITVPNDDYPDNCPEAPFPGAPTPPCNVTKDVPFSQFFNDVWRSKDGVRWERRTAPTPANAKNRWSPRAGASAVSFKGELYIMGGSLNDDAAIDGAAPERIYFNDVWKSKNGGKTWTNLTKNKDPDSRWSPRAGGIAVVKDDYIYMIGGEVGFICQPLPFCDPPYFNDVWRSKDGANWELVTDDAGWAPRPGHQVLVANNKFVLFGGFGLLENPQDVWVSKDGKIWDELDKGPWDDAGSDQIKYDFDAVVTKGYGKYKDAIYTFGGDREIFDFSGNFPDNYKQVDNDVWKFSLPEKEVEEEIDKTALALLPNYPNPFKRSTTLKYSIPERSYVSINIYDRHGRFVSRLVGKTQNEGEYKVTWNARNYKNKPVKKGLYYATLWNRGKAKTIKMYKN